MTQALAESPSRDVEKVLTKLVADRAFRIGFFADPPRELRRAGLRLRPAELDTVFESPLQLLDALADD